jgi:hypothetical protein
MVRRYLSMMPMLVGHFDALPMVAEIVVAANARYRLAEV